MIVAFLAGVAGGHVVALAAAAAVAALGILEGGSLLTGEGNSHLWNDCKKWN